MEFHKTFSKIYTLEARDRLLVVPLVQCLPRRMLNLTKTIRLLKQERDQTRRKLDQLDAALKVLSGLGSVRTGFRRGRTGIGRRRTMSTAARKRIAAAQRARWAKWKASHPPK
jgi:hypothetical protein